MRRDFSASVTFMFRNLPVAERFAAAREAGFSGVEIQFLEEAPLDVLVAAKRTSGIPVRLINCGLGDFITGGPGLSGVPGREDLFREKFRAALEAAAALEAKYLHIGPSRVMDEISDDDAFRTYADNVRWAVNEARGAEIILLLEPLNRADVPLSVQADWERIAGFIREIASENLRMLFDTFHCAADGQDPVQAFERYKDIVAHIQIADFPGRAEPGRGEIGFSHVLKAFEAAGYSGSYGAEYMPQGLTGETLEWMAELGEKAQ